MANYNSGNTGAVIDAQIDKMESVTASATELNYVGGVTSAIQTQMDTKAPLASPTLTGTPIAPTAGSGTDTTQIATTAFVQSAVQGEDTLAEMNDTSLSSPDDSDFLVHNGTAWVNESGATARTSLGVDASGTINYTHPNHSGDVTSVSDGATTIANDAVTYAKMQNVSATDRILGRDTSGAGIVEEITPANVRAMINVEDGSTADQSNAEIKTAYEANVDTNEFSDAEQTKLSGIETSATANDTDVNLKARANHTGTQTASTISDFDTEVANNSAVTTNTAKVSNVTHTGDVTGSTSLSIASDVVGASELGVTAGTVTASKAVVVDASSKVDVWNVDNIKIDGNTITSEDTNGNITLTPNGTGDVEVSSGNVGIGTASPAVGLDVHKDNEISAGFGRADDGTNYISVRTAETQNNLAGIAFMVGSTTQTGVSSIYQIGGIASKVTNSGGALTGDMIFSTNSGDSIAERLRIDSSGGLHQSVSSSFAGSKTGITESTDTEILNVKIGDGYGEGAMITLDLFNKTGDTYAVKCERWLIAVRHGASDATTVVNIFRSATSSENNGFRNMDDATVTTVVDGDGDIHIRVNAVVSGSGGYTTYDCYYKAEVVSNAIPVFTAG